MIAGKLLTFMLYATPCSRLRYRRTLTLGTTFNVLSLPALSGTSHSHAICTHARKRTQPQPGVDNQFGALASSYTAETLSRSYIPEAKIKGHIWSKIDRFLSYYFYLEMSV